MISIVKQGDNRFSGFLAAVLIEFVKRQEQVSQCERFLIQASDPVRSNMSKLSDQIQPTTLLNLKRS